MLSIGVMSPGQARYYVDLAREDYYLEGGEPPGVWLGTGAGALALSGTVAADQLYNLFAGKSPDGSRDLIQRQRHENKAEHRAGWDLTFSAPKSVSALWALSDRETRESIESAHFDAVRVATDFIESEAGRTRRGKGGAELEAAGLVLASYEHGTSRALDPQLHTHVLLLNVCVREDGTTGAVSSTLVFDYKMAAGAVYRAELQRSLLDRIELETRVSGAFFEIQGVPQELTHGWSTRRKEIESELERRGVGGGKESARATLETRTAKESLPREELFAKWEREALEFGWSPDEVRESVRKAGSPAVTPRESAAEVGRLVREKSEVYHAVATDALGTRASGREAVVKARQDVSDMLSVGGDRVAKGAPELERDHPEPQRRSSPERQAEIGVTGGGEDRVRELKGSNPGTQWHTVEGFFARVQAEHRRDVVKAITSADLGPNLLQPLEAFLERYGPNLHQPLRQLAARYGPDLRTLGKFGPDVTQVFSSLMRAISEPDSIANAGSIVLDMPERIPTKSLFAIFDYAATMETSPSIYRAPEPAWRPSRRSDLSAMIERLRPERPMGVPR